MTSASLDNQVCGPGGADFVGDKVFLHGWVNGSRHLYVADLGWAGDFPVVRGSRVRTEAESGTLQQLPGPDRRRRCVQGRGRGVHRLRRLLGREHVLRPARRQLHAVGRVRERHRQGPPPTVSLSTATRQGAVSYPVTGWDKWRQTSVT